MQSGHHHNVIKIEVTYNLATNLWTISSDRPSFKNSGGDFDETFAEFVAGLKSSGFDNAVIMIATH